MGYYSYLNFDFEKGTKINKERAKKLEQEFREENEDPKVTGFRGVKLVCDDEGYLQDIELDDYYRKFYGDSYFAESLSKVLERGSVSLLFLDDDGNEWGHLIKPNKVERLIIFKFYLTEEMFNKYQNQITELQKVSL